MSATRTLNRHDHQKTIGGQLRQVPAFGIVNLEDPAAEHFVQATKSPVMGFTSHGEAGRGSSFVAENSPDIPFVEAKNIGLKQDGTGISFRLGGNVAGLAGKEFVVEAPTSGAFNAYNCTCRSLKPNPRPSL